MKAGPLRVWACGLTLVLLALIQQPGWLVGDTKLDLVVDPGRYMARALQMWDGSGAFGQIQNQAYGYLFPMGPFYWLGLHTGLAGWVVQRLWWAVLLNLAFFGTWQVARTLDLGRGWTRLVGAFCYALAAHITGVIGGSSVEVWPTALAPWVLWALVRGTQTGHRRRWAALAALVVFAGGGVNAAAVSAMLPLGVVWLLTRRGRGRLRLLGWWVLFTGLATLWWLIPLALMGKYSFPFLDYIETASITTVPTDVWHILIGTSDWVSFVDPRTYHAGWLIATTPMLVLNLTAILVVGLLGCVRRDNPYRLFLVVSIIVGVLLVGMGYAGPGHGLGAEWRQSLLDGALAPLRNVHKFDAVLRLPLALGVAHQLSRILPERAPGSAQPLGIEGIGRRLAPLVIGLVVVAISSPWFVNPSVAPAGPFAGVPRYWQQAARYVDSHPHGRSLVVPAAAFGDYTWGWPRDDVMEPLVTGPWAVRNVVPLAQPGNVLLLDAVTRLLESGDPNRELAQLLAANGIGTLVVRNDLDRLQTGAPDPAVLAQQLTPAYGFTRVASFGPVLGFPGVTTQPDGTRMVTSGGVSLPTRAVQIFRVQGEASVVSASEHVMATNAPPGAASEVGRPSIFVATAPPRTPLVLTDELRRRETNFAAVRRNQSDTMTAKQAWALDRPLHYHQIAPDEPRWFSLESWTGIRGVSASSSMAQATAPVIDRGAGPEAAVDMDPRTAWQPNQALDAPQWWQENLQPHTQVDRLRITLGPGSQTSRLLLSAGNRKYVASGLRVGSSVSVDPAFGPVRELRVSSPNGAPFSLAEVAIPGVRPQRYVRLPDPGRHRVDEIGLYRDPSVSGCYQIWASYTCSDALSQDGDDGDTIARQIALRAPGRYRIAVSGSVRPTSSLGGLVSRLPVTVSSGGASADQPGDGPLAMLDDDAGTAWIAPSNAKIPDVVLRWRHRVKVGSIGLVLSDDVPASKPSEVRLSMGGQSRKVTIDKHSRATFKPLRGRTLELRILSSVPAYSGSAVPGNQLPVGVSSLQVRRTNTSADLASLATYRVAAPCGSGPSVDVAGSMVATRLFATVPGLVRGHISVSACAHDVELPSGRFDIVAKPTNTVRLDSIVFRSDRLTASGSTPIAPGTWGDSSRSFEVVPGITSQLLIVSENYNPGWKATLSGRTLAPVEVDGWRQGWWVPAGLGGQAHLTFAPQRTFTLGLLAGVVGVLIVLLASLWPCRRGRHMAVREREGEVSASSGRVLLPVLLLLLAATAAGWVGLVLTALLVVISWILGRRWEMAGAALAWSMAATLVLLGVWADWQLTQEPVLHRSWQVQMASALALLLGFGGLLKRPTSFRRSMGRSTQ